MHQHFAVLVAGEERNPVVMIGACETIEPQDYAKYQIPADAISAVGDWWAGSGDYAYLDWAI